MSRRQVHGFTLLELLVVVVIIGIVVAGAILSLGATGRDRGLQDERDRLTALIGYVRDRAALMTTEYGILCGQHGYRFVYYDARTQQWQPETLDDTLRERQLPEGLSLQLVIEGRPVVLDDATLRVGPSAGSIAALGSSAATSAGAGAPAAPAGTPAGTDTSGSQLGTTDAQSNAPQIMLLSNGDTNAFELTLLRTSVERSVTLKSAADGSISAGDIVDAPH
jgi:general secretion pathway protein H